MIIHKKVSDLEILENSPMYFKMHVKDFTGPLKLAILYKEADYLKGMKPDLTIYFSFTNKKPSAADHCKVSINVRIH